jgi:hypothetical protein
MVLESDLENWTRCDWFSSEPVPATDSVLASKGILSHHLPFVFPWHSKDSCRHSLSAEHHGN